MSDKWEMVSGKKQKARPKNPEPKPEDILPPNQFRNYSASLKQALQKDGQQQSDGKGSKQNGTTSSSSSPTKKKQLVTKVQPKKDRQVSGISTYANKPKPKNIELALANINVDTFAGEIVLHEATFPNNHLLLLQRISTYLNDQIPLEVDPLFTGKPYLFPSTATPCDLKELIYKYLDNAGMGTVQYFFDQCLTSIAVDMSKNQLCIGYRLMVQLIAIKWPNVCNANSAKSALLLSSYQNRSNIGLTLLWALGMGGFRDVTVGLKVWLDIMVPLWELKAYRKYVCEYVDRIVSHSIDRNDCTIRLLQSELFIIFDTLSQAPHKDYQKVFQKNALRIITYYIRGGSKVSNIFLRFFIRLKTNIESDALYDILLHCICKGDDTFKIWTMNYKKHVTESNLLLSYIDEHFREWSAVLEDNNAFNRFLNSLIKIDATLDNINDPYSEFNRTRQLVASIQKKSSSNQSGSSSICPWVFGILLLAISIGGLIAYDTNAHGGVFAKSTVGTVLKDIGALPYVETAWTKSMSTSARGYQWAEQNVPVYVSRTAEFLKPYGELTRDLSIVGWNAAKKGFGRGRDLVLSKAPLVINTIEQYVPGLPKKIQDASVNTWDILTVTSKNIYNTTFTFLKTQVFVGKLSPENLCNMFNQTQLAAAQYYSWFHQKVDTYAKIQ